MPVVNAPATRETSGISTSAPTFLFRNLPEPTPMRINKYFSDFNSYLGSAEWTETTTNSGTIALADANGGKLVLTSGATSGNVAGIQLVKKSFAFTTGSQVWFAINVSFADATLGSFKAGLGNDFSGDAPTDGVYFSKASGSTTLNLIIRAASTSTTIAIGTVAAATAYTFGYYLNAGAVANTLYAYSTIGSVAPNTLPYPYFSGGNTVAAFASTASDATNSLANLPLTTTLLTLGCEIAAGSSAAKAVTVDYIYAAEEIVARY